MIWKRSRGEMDITTVFGTVVGGSNPSGSTISEAILLPEGFERRSTRSPDSAEFGCEAVTRQSTNGGL